MTTYSATRGPAATRTVGRQEIDSLQSPGPVVIVDLAVGMELSAEQVAELRELIGRGGAVATRARIVLWTAEGKRRQEVSGLAGVSLPTVDRWVDRYAAYGVAGLTDRKRGAGREQVPALVRARIVELTKQPPPADAGVARWSSRLLAGYLARTEGIAVSWNYVARVWREENLRPVKRPRGIDK